MSEVAHQSPSDGKKRKRDEPAASSSSSSAHPKKRQEPFAWAEPPICLLDDCARNLRDMKEQHQASKARASAAEEELHTLKAKIVAERKRHCPICLTDECKYPVQLADGDHVQSCNPQEPLSAAYHSYCFECILGMHNSALRMDANGRLYVHDDIKCCVCREPVGATVFAVKYIPLDRQLYEWLNSGDTVMKCPYCPFKDLPDVAMRHALSCISRKFNCPCCKQVFVLGVAETGDTKERRVQKAFEKHLLEQCTHTSRCCKAPCNNKEVKMADFMSHQEWHRVRSLCDAEFGHLSTHLHEIMRFGSEMGEGPYRMLLQAIRLATARLHQRQQANAENDIISILE